MRNPSNGSENLIQRSHYLENPGPAPNVRQIARRFESPAAERRSRALNSRSKSTPRGFMNYPSESPQPIPPPDYEQEEILDIRSPRQFRSPPSYPRSSSSTPRLPRTPPSRFPIPDSEDSPRISRQEHTRKLRRTPEELSYRDELKSPMTLDSRQESPLFTRNGATSYFNSPPPQGPVSRSKSSTSNGFHNKFPNGTLKNGTTNGVQKANSTGNWAFDPDIEKDDPYVLQSPDVLEHSASRTDFLTSPIPATSIRNKMTPGSPPATRYMKEPWKLTIRREVCWEVLN